MSAPTAPMMKRLSPRRAFTIIEAVISTIIVAVMFVAALSTVGASRRIQQQTVVCHESGFR